MGDERDPRREPGRLVHVDAAVPRYANSNNIPFAVYRQAYHSDSQGRRDPSPSEQNLSTMAPLAYGNIPVFAAPARAIRAALPTLAAEPNALFVAPADVSWLFHIDFDEVVRFAPRPAAGAGRPSRNLMTQRYEELERKLGEILAEARPLASKGGLAEASDYLDQGEYGLALDTLVYAIANAGDRVDARMYAQIIQLGRLMRLDDSAWAAVRPLE